MSNYWQGKGAGKRIAIRFNKPLLGDVSGNEGAFTITGLVRDPLKYGPLVERTFTVESVERYPLERYWRDEFDGDMDGLEAGEYGLRLEAVEGDMADKVIGQEVVGVVGASRGKNRNLLGQTFTLLGSASKIAVEVYIGTKSIPKYDIEAFIYLTSAGLPTGNPIASSSTYHASEGWARFEFEAELPGGVLYGFAWRSTSAETSDLYEAYAVTADVYAGGAWAYHDGTVWRKNDAADATFRVFVPILEYPDTASRTLSLDATELPETPRFRCETSTPDDTGVIIEYACTDGSEPDSEDWAEIEDGDLLTITGTTLWLRYTLTTDDPAVTPTLLSAWLEEATAPPGTILLTMTPDSRFNDAEGDLTVSYEQATGTLTGNRPVEDFTESFTPTGLEPTPIDRHDITAGIEVAVDLIKVDYRYFKDDSADHIITAGITVDVALIPVSEIPP